MTKLKPWMRDLWSSKKTNCAIRDNRSVDNTIQANTLRTQERHEKRHRVSGSFN